MENVYQENGYKNRYDYLVCLSEEYGVDKGTVFAIASMLGETEDFDGLVSQLNDMEGF
jgi:hypothetical protein